MKKKGIIGLIVLVLLVQIAVPVGIIIYRRSLNSKTIEQGTDYKFEILLRTVSGGEISYILKGVNPQGDPSKKYAYIYTDDDGFSSLGTAQTHHDDEYVRLDYRDRKNFPQVNVFSTESTVRYQSFVRTQDLDPIYNTRFYLLVRIYDGRPEILGMFHESGKPIDEWLQENEETINEWTKQYGYDLWYENNIENNFYEEYNPLNDPNSAKQGDADVVAGD